MHSDHSFSLSTVLCRRALSVSEAAAVVLEVHRTVSAEPRRGVPAPAGVRVSADGTLAVEGCAAVPAGADAGEYARLLNQLLPPRAPGALRLAIARAWGGGELPPFPTTDAFLEIAQRFVEGDPREVVASLWREAKRQGPLGRIDDLSDVRRARRASRRTLREIAEDTALSVAILRELEWGDFRRWRNPHWTARVASEYARVAGLDGARVVALVEAERMRQVTPAREQPRERPLTTVEGRRPAHRLWRGVAAAGVIAGVVAVGAAAVVFGPRAAAPEHSTGGASVPLSAPAAASATARPSQSGASPNRPRESPRERPAPAPQPSSPEPTSTPARGGSSPSPAARTTPAPAPAVRRAFSPAFDPASAAVFFHRDEEDGGSVLMQARQDGDGGSLRLLRIVDDGAKNYHVRPSPDGSQIAFDSDRDGERAVYVARSDGSGVRRVSAAGYAAVPAWSPDGRRLVYLRGEPARPRVWNLWLHDLSSDVVVRLTAHPYGQTWGGSWFADGRRIAYSHEDRLLILDLDTGRRRQFRSPVAGRLVRTPAVSPDGRHIAFQVHRDGGWLLDARDGSMRRILADPTAEEFAWDRGGRRLAFHSRRSGTWSIWVMAPSAS